MLSTMDIEEAIADYHYFTGEPVYQCENAQQTFVNTFGNEQQKAEISILIEHRRKSRS